MVFPNTDYFDLLRLLFRVHLLHSHCYIFCDPETEHVLLSGRNPYDAKLDGTMRHFMRFALQTNDPPAAWAGWHAWSTLTWVKTKKGVDTSVDELTNDDVRSGMGYHWRRSSENIAFLEKGKRKLNELGWSSVLLGPRAGKDDPPTMKPISVLERLVLNSSNPGETVLDPFAGSGTTITAALLHDRRAIGIEINEDAAIEAAARIKEATGIDPTIIAATAGEQQHNDTTATKAASK